MVYTDADKQSQLTASTIPILQQLAGKAESKLPRLDTLTVYDYPGSDSYLFASPFQKPFDYAVEAVSHTRNLTFLKRHMNGPYFDLEAIWDEHTYFEFDARLVDHTMGTMVQEPYVNHIPTVRDNFFSILKRHQYFNIFSRSLEVSEEIDFHIFTHIILFSTILKIPS